MSLLEDLHAAHKARQRRFSAAAIKPAPIEITPVRLEAPVYEKPIGPIRVRPLEMIGPIKIADSRPITFKPRPITQVLSTCCMYFNVPRFDLLARGRSKTSPVYARQVAMYLAKTVALGSLPEIGRHFGGRDHTTILHAFQKIGRLIKSDWTVAYDVARIEAIL